MSDTKGEWLDEEELAIFRGAGEPSCVDCGASLKWIRGGEHINLQCTSDACGAAFIVSDLAAAGDGQVARLTDKSPRRTLDAPAAEDSHSAPDPAPGKSFRSEDTF